MFCVLLLAECGEDKEYKCVPGRWFVPAAMTAFLIVANILLLNLLIAVFKSVIYLLNELINIALLNLLVVVFKSFNHLINQSINNS